MNKKKDKKKIKKIKTPSYPRIALLGFRGIGKSSTAYHLSKIWQFEIISTDKLITQKTGKSIQEIVELEGWDEFRKQEGLILKELSERENVLIDTGGGIIEKANGTPSEENIKLLFENFFSIYLTMSDHKVIQRMGIVKKLSHRPKFIEGEKEILLRRKPSYLRASRAVVDIEWINSWEVAERIIQIVKK